MNASEFLQKHGFEQRQDKTDFPILNYYVKEIGFCNSNCIGCEYAICIVIYFADRQYNVSIYFYKPTMKDENLYCKWKYMVDGMPFTTLPIGYFERNRFDYVIIDCVSMIRKVMLSMDFKQITGLDFIDISDSNNVDETANKECERLLNELGEREEKVL